MNTNDSQLAVSHAIREEWRGRSLVSSRQGRCLPGSSVSIFMLWVFLIVQLYVYFELCNTAAL
jgi:hypothetical protein